MKPNPEKNARARALGLRIVGRRTAREPSNVLITRLSAIGDCVLTLPLAVAAKRLWPRSRLTWIVDCAAEQLLTDHPAIDEVIRIERKWLQKPGNWSKLRADLTSREFDLVLDPQGLTKSSMLGWISGAKTRVGFDYSHGREIAPLLANRRIHRTARHMIDTYLQLLGPWQKMEPGSGEFQMPHYAEASETATRILKDHALDPVSASGWIAINPGAGWTTRQWPVDRFGKLAREMLDRFQLRSFVFWAGDNELLMANVIAEESHGAATVAPKTNLRELAELLRRSTMLVSCDTGPLHIASAVGTPAVSLHGPTWADEVGPYGNLAMAIQSPSPHISRKAVRRGPNTAMQAIELEEVTHACSRLLASLVCSPRIRLAA